MNMSLLLSHVFLVHLKPEIVFEACIISAKRVHYTGGVLTHTHTHTHARTHAHTIGAEWLRINTLECTSVEFTGKGRGLEHVFYPPNAVFHHLSDIHYAISF